jgi:hypothetical protein
VSKESSLNRNKWLLVLAVLGLVGVFFALDLGRYFSLAYAKGAQADFAALYATRPLAVVAATSPRSTCWSRRCRCPAR